MNPLQHWQARHGVSDAALLDLRRILSEPAVVARIEGASESAVQSRVRLEAARKNVMLWRNNSGAYEDRTGRWIRYGLANDSAALNAELKSPDLVGWRPRVIIPADVGTTIAQTVLRECKEDGWRWSGSAREQAQLRFLTLGWLGGCDAAFASGEGTL